ncbi:MAG TPA: hypothetical protein VEQ10_00440, partial [Vicinamibacteria bacterium]|nr:hypothetical protein [Vicinamibacteria bacterium]
MRRQPSISRRGTLRLLGAAPLAVGLAARAAAKPTPPPPKAPLPPPAAADKPYWVVRPDGSFDMVTPAIQLRDCFPCFDGTPIRVVSVKVAPGPRGGTDATY